MNHRGEVGPGNLFDAIGAQQFNVLTGLGLREHHSLLDIGCGSLRGGRLFIVYLQQGKYHGIEPNAALVQAGIDQELGQSVIDLKKPTFYHFDDFRLTTTGKQFDFILAQSIFSHAGFNLVQRTISEAASSIVKGGKFAATFFQGEGGIGKGWLGHGVTTHTLKQMVAAGRQWGFKVNALDVKHPVGQTWICYTKL